MGLFVKVLVCLTVVVLWDCVYANLTGPVITCNAPPVSEGETASVTCNFNTSVAAIRPAHFAVDFYAQDSGSPVEIAECRKLHTDNLECTTKRPGEVFRTTEEPDELVLEIAEVKKSHAGRYVCKLSAQDVNDPMIRPCTFSLKAPALITDLGTDISTAKGSTPSTLGLGVNVSPANKASVDDNVIIIAASAGGAAVFIIIVIVLVVVLVRRRKRGQGSVAKRTKGKDPEQPLMVQESPKPARQPRPTSAALKPVKEEGDGSDESSCFLPDTAEDQNEEEEEGEKKEQYKPRRRSSSLSEEVEVLAAVKQYGVKRKMSNKEFPWDGSVENLNRHAV